jgi:hypothetical protein
MFISVPLYLRFTIIGRWHHDADGLVKLTATRPEIASSFATESPTRGAEQRRMKESVERLEQMDPDCDLLGVRRRSPTSVRMAN